MAIVKLDGKDFDTEEMNDKALTQVRAAQFVINEINRLKMQLAALETARIAYTNALATELKQNSDDDSEIEVPDNISFD